MDYVDIGTNMTDSEYLEEVLGAQHMGLKVGTIIEDHGAQHMGLKVVTIVGVMGPGTWV